VVLIVNGSELSVPAAAREGRRRNLSVAIEDVIRRWGNENPGFVARFDAAMQEERGRLNSKNALTRDKHFMARGCIPGRLNTMMCREINKDWKDDPDCLRVFWDLFKIGRLNPNAAVGRWTR
jgi:hypothetical protein